MKKALLPLFAITSFNVFADYPGLFVQFLMNPATFSNFSNGHGHVSDKTNKAYTFELYDILVKKVNELINIIEKQFNIKRSGLENGMYFYKIYTSEK